MKSTGYEVYIKCYPSDDLRECIAPILAKHKLKMSELMDVIIIYKPRLE